MSRNEEPIWKNWFSYHCQPLRDSLVGLFSNQKPSGMNSMNPRFYEETISPERSMYPVNHKLWVMDFMTQGVSCVGGYRNSLCLPPFCGEHSELFYNQLRTVCFHGKKLRLVLLNLRIGQIDVPFRVIGKFYFLTKLHLTNSRKTQYICIISSLWFVLFPSALWGWYFRVW